MEKYIVKLISKKALTNEVLELRFSKPAGFDFTPGQFIQFLIPDNDEKKTRAYSIASIQNDDYLEFSVKLRPNGLASEHFKKMNAKDELEMNGPFGHFVCEEKSDEYIFIATGCGLASIISMIRNKLENEKTDKKILLLFGVGTEQDVFWKERLERLVEKYPNFSFKLCLSRPNEEWKREKGRVTAHLQNYINKKFHYYICGSTEMIKEIREMLERSGINTSHVHFEMF